ncbi:putative (S)-norcoclaurine synthase [Helianthus annuus]|nr:putative (S)-norcoclaurine synthase [Helianthus annuus]KAJ0857650.1 putative (S)-norcoclaurine synthase [Helianthus annuus]
MNKQLEKKRQIKQLGIYQYIKKFIPFRHFSYIKSLTSDVHSQRKMFGTLSEEVEVKVPASKAWALYGTLEIGKLVVGKVLEAVDLIEGDGGPGTILKLTLKPGFPYYKEKFTKVDNENMIKETEVVEGGFLDVGFTLYRIRFEIKENPNDDTGSSCLQKLTIEYDVKEEFAANASFVTNEPLLGLLKVANEYLLKSN